MPKPETDKWENTVLQPQKDLEETIMPLKLGEKLENITLNPKINESADQKTAPQD